MPVMWHASKICDQRCSGGLNYFPSVDRYGYVIHPCIRWDERRYASEKTKRMSPVYRIAAVYVAMGDKDQALEWLEKAFQQDSGWLVWLKVDPVMDPLRSNLRFQSLLRRLNFPP